MMSHYSHELEHGSFQQWWSRGPFPSGWVHPSPGALHCQWQESERAQRILWNCKMCGVHQIRCKVPEGEAQCIVKFPQILIVISVIYFCPYSPLTCTLPAQVALQFPDFLLRDAAKVTSLLSKETGASLFVLGDTSYGRLSTGVPTAINCNAEYICSSLSCSCCVDEVAAEHVQADCIIHFGPGCLTQ